MKPPALPPITAARVASAQPSRPAASIPATVSVTSSSPQAPSSAACVAAPVPRRAAVVRAQHRPSARHEVPDPRLPVHRALVGRAPVHVDEQRRGRAGHRIVRGQPQQTVHGRAVGRRPGHRLRLGEVDRVELARRAPRQHGAVTGVGREHGELGRGAATGAHARDAVGPPVESGVPPARQVAGVGAAERYDDQSPEAVLVAVQRDGGARGRPRERALSGAPRRFRVFAWFLEDGSRARAVRRREPDVHPAAFVGHVREGLVDRGEPRLPDRDRAATGDDAWWRVAACDHDSGPVPRHVGQVPLVPRERATVVRPRRIPRVVGV